MAQSTFEVHTPPAGPATPLIAHIPHSSTAIPPAWRAELVLDDAGLEAELLAMTDRYTEELFAPAALAAGGCAFVNGISRLVFDPERFEDDGREPMAAIGHGAVYTRTSGLAPLRRAGYSAEDRERALEALFRPYARALEALVSRCVDRFGWCLLVDGHSFPSRALPYEDATLARPDLCLGFEDFHAPEALVEALEAGASAAGWTVGRNTPFSGSYVPLAHYRREPRVLSVMIEINRGRYMAEATGAKNSGYAETERLVAALAERAAAVARAWAGRGEGADAGTRDRGDGGGAAGGS